MKTILTIFCAISIVFAAAMPVQAADCDTMLEQYKQGKGYFHPLRKLRVIERCYNKAIERDPDVVANYYGLAQVKYRQGEFYPALHQLELARRHNPTKKELCEIEALAMWLRPNSVSSLQKMARVCRKVDPEKANMARSFIKAKAAGRRNMYSPMRKKLGENIALVKNGMTEEQVIRIIGFKPDYHEGSTKRGKDFICMEWFYEPIPAYEFDGEHYTPKGKRECVGLKEGLVYTKKPCSIFNRK